MSKVLGHFIRFMFGGKRPVKAPSTPMVVSPQIDLVEAPMASDDLLRRAMEAASVAQPDHSQQQLAPAGYPPAERLDQMDPATLDPLPSLFLNGRPSTEEVRPVAVADLQAESQSPADEVVLPEIDIAPQATLAAEEPEVSFTEADLLVAEAGNDEFIAVAEVAEAPLEAICVEPSIELGEMEPVSEDGVDQVCTPEPESAGPTEADEAVIEEAWRIIETELHGMFPPRNLPDEAEAVEPVRIEQVEAVEPEPDIVAPIEEFAAAFIEKQDEEVVAVAEPVDLAPETAPEQIAVVDEPATDEPNAEVDEVVAETPKKAARASAKKTSEKSEASGTKKKASPRKKADAPVMPEDSVYLTDAVVWSLSGSWREFWLPPTDALTSERVNAFREQAAEGSLAVWGLVGDTDEWALVPAAHWKKSGFDPLSFMAGREKLFTEAKATPRSKKPPARYTGLKVSRQQVELLWTPAEGSSQAAA